MARERYDRPMNLFEAASPDRARAGAEALDSFQSGMRASHVGAPSIDTVIAHSYGSTMVGAAATGGHRLDAPNGYILQIIARYKPGYPPSLQGISPCFPQSYRTTAAPSRRFSPREAGAGYIALQAARRRRQDIAVD